MIKLFTHTDLDGVGCNIVASVVYSERCFNENVKVDVEYVDYDEINDAVIRWIDAISSNGLSHDYYEECFITDISVNDEVASILDKLDIPVHLFDHHATALTLNRYDWCEVKTEIDGIKTCGTELFFNYLYERYAELLDIDYNRRINFHLAEFANIVKEWDTWTWVSKPTGIVSKQMNDLLCLYGRNKFEKTVLDFIAEASIDNHFRDCFFGSTEKLILEIHQREINEYVASKEKSLQICEINGYTAGIIFSDRFSSEMGHLICEQHPELDFVAMINLSNSTISFRTNKEIDVGKAIAQPMGGGGHPKAAGAPITSSLISKIIDLVFKGEIHNGF